MAEYIEREALLNRLEAIKESADWDSQSKYVLFGIKEFINNAPAAAVQPIVEGALHDGEQDVAPVVHGQWENITDGMVMLGDCSECKERQPVLGTNYCKNCGAKMDGE